MFLDKGLTITEIEDLLDVDRTTVWRIKKRFLDFGLERGLTDDARSGQPTKYITLLRAELTALACGPGTEREDEVDYKVISRGA
jgi:hypothetical protein